MPPTTTPTRERVPGRLPYVTGVAGALLIAFSAVFVRLSGASPSTAATFRCAYALPLLALLAVRERRRHGARRRPERVLALLAGVCFAADLTLFHHTIGLVGAGLATVLANTQVVLVALLGWALLGERPQGRVLVAVPIVMSGVVLISGVVGSAAYGRDPTLGVALGLLTGLAYAGFVLLLRQSNTDDRRPSGPLFDATLAGAVVAALGGLVAGDLVLTPGWPAHGWLALLALTAQVLAWLLISVSLPRLPAVVTSLLLLLQPVGAVLLGVALLGEAPSPAQSAGVVVVVAGIACATLGPTRRPDRPFPS